MMFMFVSVAAFVFPVVQVSTKLLLSLRWLEWVCAVGNLGLAHGRGSYGACSSCLVMSAVPGDGTLPGSHFSCAGEFAGTGSKCVLVASAC